MNATFPFEKLGRLLRRQREHRPTWSPRVGIRIARLIFEGQEFRAFTVFAIFGGERGVVVPWPEAEARAIAGACEYARHQWMSTATPADFGVDTQAAKDERRRTFIAMADTCGERVVLALIRRPGNALNVEIGQPQDRCRGRTPPEWGDVDPRAARWIWSGGDPMILGTCSRARCPRLIAAAKAGST